MNGVSRCECGELMTIVFPSMDLVCEGCGYIATPARLKYQKRKSDIDQPVRGTSEPDHKEVMAYRTTNEM
jgi:hypothetical protein